MKKGMTLNEFLAEEQRRYPQATGDFTELFSELITSTKKISRQINKASLNGALGISGRINVHGEAVQKLDEMANETLLQDLSHGGHLAGMASEEMEDIFQIPTPYPVGKYVLLFDPVDGSSNIDVNVNIGTIFSIYRRRTAGNQSCMRDFLQAGWEQICGGYVVYGSSTMLVYTTGCGVNGFTLDPDTGEFLLSHEDIMIPQRGTIYSANECYYDRWENGVQRFINNYKTREKASSRYIGSLVADFHRNLLKGGVFLYPADAKAPQGKLRLMYEANPLAFIVEQAGGRASDGVQRILDVQPKQLHQRVALIIGSAEDVTEAERFIAEGREVDVTPFRVAAGM